MRIMKSAKGDARLALRVEGEWVHVDVHSPDLKTPLSFYAGNFDYVMQRGEPFFIKHPQMVARVRRLIDDGRKDALSSLPAYMWQPATVGVRISPPLIDRVLFFFLSKEDAVAFPGDHAEVFERSVEILGPRGARLWYLKEVAWMACDTTLTRIARVLRVFRGKDE
jgi:hypothetical protein